MIFRWFPPAGVLDLHGMGGFRDLLWADYYYHVPETLRAKGYDVFTPISEPFNGTPVRAASIAAPAAALRIAIGVLLLSFMIGGWVRFRDDIKKSLANAAAESRGQKSRTGSNS
mgnify:CR=1 FL=1